MDRIYLQKFHLTQEYTFFTAVHGTFSKINHNRKQSKSKRFIGKFETLCILSDHNGIQKDTNCNRNGKEDKNSQKLNNTLLKEENLQFPDLNENENATS